MEEKYLNYNSEQIAGNTSYDLASIESLKHIDIPLEKQPNSPAERKKVPAIVRFKLMATVGYVVNWIVLAVLLISPTEAFGSVFNPIALLEFAISIFNIKLGNIYVTLVKVALIIMYLVILIMMIKNIVTSSRKFSMVFSKKAYKKDPNSLHVATGGICSIVESSLVEFYVLVIITYMLSGSNFTWGTWLMICLGIVYTCVIAFCSSFPRKEYTEGEKPVWINKSWSIFITRMINHLLMLAGIITLMFFIVIPAIYNMAFGVQVLFNGLYNNAYDFLNIFYNMFLKHSFDMTIIFIYIALLQKFIGAYGVNFGFIPYIGKLMVGKCRSIIIISGISIVFACVVPLLSTGNSIVFTTELLMDWFDIIRVQYLPIILLCVGLMLLVSIGQNLEEEQ